MSFEPSNEHYTTCSTLGRCFFDKGTILLSKHNSSGSLVAVKHFNLEKTTQEEFQLIKDEVIRMRQLKHPNVVTCLTSYVVNFDLYILSPLIGYGSCQDLISTHFRDGLPELVIASFLRDILEALDYIHRKGYIHRAVKARHILVHADGRAYLSGLRYMYFRGFSSDPVFDFPVLATHNLNWISPELLEQSSNGYNEKSDVYSVGITACEMANGIVPFSEASTTLMLTEKVRGMSPQLLDHSTWVLYEESNEGDESATYQGNSIPNKYAMRQFTEPFHVFVELCSHRNVNIRPSPKQLLNHSFFKQLRRHSVNISELLQPAIPFNEVNTTELNLDVDTINSLSCKMNDCSVYQNEWNF